jgi:DNA repair exonuclease SbcCD nuclease subunit
LEIALIGDTHAGHKNDSLLFQDYFKRFYDQVFFPELEKRSISTIIHVGDVFDRRKYVNFHILQRTRVDFLEKLADYDTHFLCGNHDVYFRDSNETNALRELVYGRYSKIHIYEEPQELVIDGLKILLMPWLNPTNMDTGLSMIERSTASVLMGHLEIAGFKFDQTQVCEHGMDKNIFGKFKKVFSGHFHHASEEGPIRYLGAPYEYTFADLNDPKGFYIFDTDTLELEFIQNPERMFYRVIYDDREEDAAEKLLGMDFSEFEGKMVRIIVPYKNNPVLYEQWIDKLIQNNPSEWSIKEQLSLEVDGEIEEMMFEEFKVEGGQVVHGGTAEILDKYIDALETDVNKDRLKGVLRELLVEATASVS